MMKILHKELPDHGKKNNCLWSPLCYEACSTLKVYSEKWWDIPIPFVYDKTYLETSSKPNDNHCSQKGYSHHMAWDKQFNMYILHYLLIYISHSFVYFFITIMKDRFQGIDGSASVTWSTWLWAALFSHLVLTLSAIYLSTLSLPLQSV